MNRPDTDAQDQLLQIITFGLQRAAGPYRWAKRRHRQERAGCASGNNRRPLEMDWNLIFRDE